MRILGVDPGLHRIGLSVIEKVHSPTHPWDILRWQTHEVQSQTLEQTLMEVHEIARTWVQQYSPHLVAVEWGGYPRSSQQSLRMGCVIGVVLLAAVQSHLPIRFFSPKTVKLALTGYGSSSKQDIRHALFRQFEIQDSHVDALDAIGVALACGLMEYAYAHRD